MSYPVLLKSFQLGILHLNKTTESLGSGWGKSPNLGTPLNVTELNTTPYI